MKKPFTLDAAQIDWDLLRDQKATLVELCAHEARLGPEALDHLSGIVHLIDYLEDEAPGISAGKEPPS
jgi:hypothetical protein